MTGVYLAGDSHAEGLARTLEHVGQDYARGRRTAAQPPLPADAEVVVVSLGTNDRPGPTLAQAVRELVATRRGRPLVWLLPPRATRADLVAERAGIVESIRAGTSGSSGVVFLDPPAVPLAPDGVHPTRAGYAQLATLVAATLTRRADRVDSAGGATVAPLALLLLGAVFLWKWR
jgi:lysophospholipase L1-like esterase